jgi:hypothetical protein
MKDLMSDLRHPPQTSHDASNQRTCVYPMTRLPSVKKASTEISCRQSRSVQRERERERERVDSSLYYTIKYGISLASYFRLQGLRMERESCRE